ncbi:MAG: hypothetical protein AAFN76_06105 [Pseudomonadota bacterium]
MRPPLFSKPKSFRRPIHKKGNPMLHRPPSALAIAAATSALFTMDASANPRFSVENQADAKVKILVFSGNDSTCAIEEKSKPLKAGKSKNFGCYGGGKGRCKVRVMFKGTRVCGDANSSCKGTAIKVKDGGHLVLSNEDGCYVE